MAKTARCCNCVLAYPDPEISLKCYQTRTVELFGTFAHMNSPQDWPPERREEFSCSSEKHW